MFNLQHLRPFYVWKPRNRSSEHLKACPYSIRDISNLEKDFFVFNNNTSLNTVEEKCKMLDDSFEAEIMAIYI